MYNIGNFYQITLGHVTHTHLLVLKSTLSHHRFTGGQGHYSYVLEASRSQET